ncbi:MAG: hypothetical protein GY820_09930 [Gammaproteobacteria bacterium]|nr:hypothetical protein [Gammaproteobacteria bacterium]
MKFLRYHVNWSTDNWSIVKIGRWTLLVDESMCQLVDAQFVDGQLAIGRWTIGR